MFGGMDPKKMQKMMSKLGIKQEEIPAEKVVIEQEGKNLVISNPNVVKVEMKGKETFQISGDVKEEEEGIREEDIKQVMEKTECSEDEAKEALEKAEGDLAQAIINLSE